MRRAVDASPAALIVPAEARGKLLRRLPALNLEVAAREQGGAHAGCRV